MGLARHSGDDAVGLAFVFVLHSCVGTFALALFVACAIRPLTRRLESVLSA